MSIRFSPEVFRDAGFHMVGYFSSSNEGNMRRFRENFGTSPLICSITWSFLVLTSSVPRGGRPEHLLWALMFLKTYATTNVLSSIAKVDEKTVRLWIWRFVEAISYITDQIVSNIYIYYISFYFII